VIRERGEVVFDFEGKPLRRTGIALDVTAEFESTEALRKSEERFHLAVQGSSAGLWDWDISTNRVYYSPRFIELLGYANDEFPAVFESFYEALHPDDRSRVEAALEEHFTDREPYDIDYRLRTKEGEYRWFQARGAVLRDESGDPYRMAGSLVDINSQKLLEADLLDRELRQRALVEELREEREHVAALNDKLEQRVHERTLQLEENARRYETLLSNLQGMAYRCRHDADWSMEYVSAGCLELLGVEPSKLLDGSCTYASLIHPDDRTMVAEVCEAGLAAGLPVQHEYRIIRPDGALRWVWEQARGVHDRDGNIEAIEGFIADVTDSKVAAFREQHQSRFYELLTTGASLPTCLNHIASCLDSEIPSLLSFVLLLDSAQTTLSLAAGPNLPDELKQSLKTIPLGDASGQLEDTIQESVNRVFYKCLSVDEVASSSADLPKVRSHLVVPIECPEKSVILGTFNVCSFTSNAIGESVQERLGWAADLANLAIQYVQAKQDLIDNEAFIRTTLDAVTAEITVLDATGRIVVTNKAWRQFARENGGSSAACNENANYLQSCCPAIEQGDETVTRIQSALRSILNGELQEWSCEYPCHSPVEDRWFWLHARRFAVNGVSHCLVLHENITSIKRTEKQLRDVATTAERASHAKSDFLATMSHELRTPLNGILGMNQLLLDSKLNERQREFAEASNASGKLLLNLINDILDLSKIEAGKLDLDLSECNLQEVITHVCNSMRYTARDKGLYLKCELSPSLSVTGVCDENRLRQILINLMGNAVKFTSSGGVTVKGTLTTQRNDLVRVRLEVIDTGVGIPLDRRDRLFQPFSQVDSSTTRQFGGTGLGLSICQRLVDLMEGTIGVDSEVGRGSVFWFELPVRIVDSSPCPSEAAAMVVPNDPLAEKEVVPRLTGHVLVAEDNHINQLYIKELLKNLGCTFTVAANGEEAVDLAAKESFDIVLMDCQMPEMDGFSATHTIRKREMAVEPVTHIPIVALTANALKGDRERCLEAGMDDYLAKPIEFKELRAVLAKYLT